SSPATACRTPAAPCAGVVTAGFGLGADPPGLTGDPAVFTCGVPGFPGANFRLSIFKAQHPRTLNRPKQTLPPGPNRPAAAFPSKPPLLPIFVAWRDSSPEFSAASRVPLGSPAGSH